MKELAVSIRIYLTKVKMPQLAGLLTYLLILTRPSSAEESALAEKISDISPDNKFAMRISYDAEMYKKMFPADKNDAEKTSSTLQRGIEDQYFFQTIRAIELVSLPGKLVVAELPWDGSAEQTSLTWSRDSKWCAFYASTARWGLSWVYHLPRDKFVPVGENVQPEGEGHGTWVTPLEVNVESDVRREWLKPIRWVKPGLLLLEQSVIFRNADAGEATYRLTASFDEKTGKFRVISKKKVPSKE